MSSSSLLALSALFFFLCVLSVSLGTSSPINHGNFLQCLGLHSKTIPIPIYTPNTSNYSSILLSTIYNLRFLTSSTPKPHLIITPLLDSHVQAAVSCSRKHGVQIKVRSGGHDFEGLSYASDVPFIIVDMFNLRSIHVDVKDRTAWVQSGALMSELYYRIAEKSPNLGFPAGLYPTVGVGGLFSGGGYGSMLRKYGLAADNVLDALIVDANGKILNKESMGEDFFWAIKGGGGGTFAIVLSWKIRLVYVPPTVTLFTITKTLEQNATALVYRWQEVAHKLPQELFIRVILSVVNSTEKGGKTIQASFNSMFLGSADKLLTVMKEGFPELGLESKDCIETSWVRSTLFFGDYPFNGSLEMLLNRTQLKETFKGKSDYVKEPIPQFVLENIWERLLEQERPLMILTPYGGRMNEISESEIPFPHRNGTLFMILYVVYWNDIGFEASIKHINWIRRLHRYVRPYVSKCPRAAYVNYRDLDMGQSKNGTATYLQGKAWGKRYFKNNYERLLKVKSKVDPENFFRHEQSIPTIAASVKTYRALDLA